MKKVLAIIFSLVFIGIGVFMIIKGNDLAKKCTKELTGKVVSIEEEINYETNPETNLEYPTYTYYPVIEYEVDGRTITKRYNTGSNSQKYKTNDTVTIMYNPDNIEEYIIKGDNSSNIIGIIFSVFGLVLLIGSILYKE